MAQNDEDKVRQLYKYLLKSWNNRNAADITGLFAEDGYRIDFDGTVLNGREAICDELNKIFALHKKFLYGRDHKRGPAAERNGLYASCGSR